MVSPWPRRSAAVLLLSSALAVLSNAEETAPDAPLRWGEDLKYCQEEVDASAGDLIPDDLLKDIIHRIVECGFVYLAPGLVKKDWVDKAYQHLEKKWDDPKWIEDNVAPVPTAGLRYDTIPPLGDGPFNAFMYEAISIKIFGQILTGVPGMNGGKLSMNIIVNALKTGATHDENEKKRLPKSWFLTGGKKPESYHTTNMTLGQRWHDDSTLWLTGAGDNNEQQIYVMFPLHDIESGFIYVAPGCTFSRRHQHNKTTGAIPAECDCWAKHHHETSVEGYAPKFLKAGSIMIHTPSLLHRGSPQDVHKNRFILSMDILSKSLSQKDAQKLRQVLGSTSHGKDELKKLHKTRASYFDSRRNKAILEVKKLKAKAQEL